MFSLSIFPMRLVWFFFLFVSFWPWEKEADEIKRSSFEIPQDERLLKVMRVALFYEKPQVLISTPSSYEIRGFPASGPFVEGQTLPATPIRSEPSGIRVGPILYKVEGLRITSRSREVQVEKKKYHNAIQVLKNPAGSLTVVNEIDVEDYLKGVVPSEVESGWPEEALKAQAVVSRTYAIFKNIENKDFPFTLGSDVGTQVYGGKSVEHPLANRAVEGTRGQILTYRGRIFATFFHSTCGGRTTRADYQWKFESHPCLRGVECPFCGASKHYRWKAEFSESEIQRLLAKKGHSVSNIEKISPEEWDASERPRVFRIRHGKETLTLPANEFRLALGPDRLKSTRIKIERKGDRFLFQGRGWGHGVGMCQWGAKHLAEIGYKYQDILRYYYPESEIRNVEEFPSSMTREPLATKERGEGNVFKKWYQKVKTYVEDL